MQINWVAINLIIELDIGQNFNDQISYVLSTQRQTFKQTQTCYSI